MEKTLLAAQSVGRIVMIALVSGGIVLAGAAPSWADRGRSEGRGEARGEQRFENRQGRGEQRVENRQGRGTQRVESRQSKANHPHQRGTVVRELPRGSRSVVVGSSRYYVHDHRFYSRGSGGYVVVRPPVGAVVATLPAGSVSITIGGVLYSRYGDVYYRRAPRGYVVVAAPISSPPSVYAPATVVVWAPTLNVRTGPGMHFPVACRVQQGQMLIVSAHASGWHYVQLPNGTFGWVMSDYTRAMGAG